MRFSSAFFRPARRPALAGLLGTLAMIAVPASALAQSCKTIPREIAVLQSEFDLMAESSPGITTAYRLCSNDGKFPRGAEDYTACMIVFCAQADSAAMPLPKGSTRCCAGMASPPASMPNWRSSCATAIWPNSAGIS